MEDSLPWYAGFFDGEGCVYIGKDHKEYGGYVHNLTVQVSQSHPEPLRAFRERWGGRVTKAENKGKTWWRWKVAAKEAEGFLRDIEPFVRVKGEVVRLALDFRETKTPRSTKLPNELFQERERIAEAIKEGNA